MAICIVINGGRQGKPSGKASCINSKIIGCIVGRCAKEQTSLQIYTFEHFLCVRTFTFVASAPSFIMKAAQPFIYEALAFHQSSAAVENPFSFFFIHSMPDCLPPPRLYLRGTDRPLFLERASLLSDSKFHLEQKKKKHHKRAHCTPQSSSIECWRLTPG